MSESRIDFPDRRTAWLAAAVAATIVAFIFAGQNYLYQRILGHPAPVRRMIEVELVRWYLWLALVPLIAAMIRRLERTGTGARRRLAIHGCAALGFVLAHAVITTLISRAIEGTGAPPYLSFPAHVATMCAVDVLVYAMIVALFHAAAYHARFRQRELFTSQLQSQVAQQRLPDLRTELQPDFLDQLARRYDTGVRLENFRADWETARLHINAWAAAQAHDRIQVDPAVTDAGTEHMFRHYLFHRVIEQALGQIGDSSGAGAGRAFCLPPLYRLACISG